MDKKPPPLHDLLPPRPWTFKQEGGEVHSFIHLSDANGDHVLSLWGRTDEKTALAEFIIAAAGK